MSQSQNIVPNGPSEDESESKNFYEPVKTPTRGVDYQQPTYTPQQVDGSTRPQLFRLDSRANLGVRPGFPNPLLRPQPPRPPPPGGTPFAQRPLISQRPPIPGQNIYPPRPIPPPNGGAPVQRPQFNPGFRPPPPNFQRPQAPVPRPQGIFQQRSVPAPTSPRPLFTTNQPLRSQTLDSSDVNVVQNADIVATPDLSANDKTETERAAALAAMKNRSFSVAGSAEPKPTTIEDRRRSVSSVGSVEDDKRLPPTTTTDAQNKHNESLSRPETRTEMHKISEDEVYAHVNNSIENLATSPVPPPKTTSKTPSPQPPHSQNVYIPQTQSPTPPPTQQTPRSPLPVIRPKPAEKLQKDDLDKSGRKTPEPKVQVSSKLRLSKTEGDNDSGVDESTQGNDHLSSEDQSSPKKSTTKNSTPRSATTPTKNKSFTRATKSPNPNPKSPDTPTSASGEKKKVPMNKVQVGSAPSPNLKVVKSKIGSLQNASHKPGGGHVKIEIKKNDYSAASSRIAAKNETYAPGGGEKKIPQQKLTWNAKSKVGSLENTTHKPKGGDKKIEVVKLDFKDKAKPKIGSKDNMKHTPGGGDVKIESKKIEIKVQSKIGSLDNIKHKPGGGEKKIYDDKEYLRQMSAHSNTSLDGSQNSSQADVREPVSDENLNRQR